MRLPGQETRSWKSLNPMNQGSDNGEVTNLVSTLMTEGFQYRRESEFRPTKTGAVFNRTCPIQKIDYPTKPVFSPVGRHLYGSGILGLRYNNLAQILRI